MPAIIYLNSKRRSAGGGDAYADRRTAKGNAAGLPRQSGLHGVFARLQSALPLLPQSRFVLPDRETDSLSTEELLAFLETRRGKLDGVCVTGGEPTLYEDLPALLRQIRGLGFAVKLDTNGTNPDMLEALAQEGLLDYAAMDIKNSPDRYAETCGGVDLLGPVKRSAALLMAGAVDYEFRTTVCAPLHTPEEMAGIGRWLKGAKRYFLQPFVDSGELVGSGMKPLTKEEIEALRDSVLPDIPSTQIRGQ